MQKKTALEDVRYVSASGAGTFGHVYFGVVDALEAHLDDYEAWRGRLLGVAGCSAGCIIALVIALGLPREARNEIRELFDLQQIMTTPDVTRLVKEYGIDDGRGLRDALQQTLMKGGLSAYSTLGDIRRLLRIEFCCTCTDLTSTATTYLSSSRTPHVTVCDAILASCAVPLVFLPRVVEGRTLVDGGLTCHLADVYPREETLFLDVDQRVQGPIRGWQEYITRIARCFSLAMHDECHRTLAAHAERHVHLRIPEHLGVTPLDMSMTRATRDALRHHGYVITVEVLTGRVLWQATAAVLRLYLGLRVVVTECDCEEQPPPA